MTELAEPHLRRRSHDPPPAADRPRTTRRPSGHHGAEVAAELATAKAAARIAVDFVTGRSDLSQNVDLAGLGVKGVIERPFDTASLSDRLIELASA